MGALALSVLAGALTTINPCVLPMLPIVLAAALGAGRFGPVALAGGLALSFAVFGTLTASIGYAAGFDPQAIRLAAAGLFVVVGLVMLAVPLQARFATATAGLADSGNTLLSRADAAGLTSGVRGQFLIGALLGLVWTPCSGPTLGAAIGLAAQAGGVPEAGLRMLAFGIGAGAVIALLAYGSRELIRTRRDRLMTLSRSARPIIGGIFVFLGILVLSGLDKVLEVQLIKVAPDWLITVTTGI